MTNTRAWWERERTDIRLRFAGLQAVLELVVAWVTLVIVMLLLAPVSMILVCVLLVVVAFFALPTAAIDLMLVADALLHVWTKQAVLFTSLVKHSLKEPSPSDDPRPFNRALVWVFRVAGWLTPWRPLARWAFAYLSRTRAALDPIFDHVDALNGYDADERERPARLTTSTQEVRAIGKETRQRSELLELIGPTWAAERFSGHAHLAGV